MVKRTKSETERFYRGLVDEQERSGLSIRVFAARRGIPAGTLSFWRHLLRQRDADRERERKEETKLGFVRVNVVEAKGAGFATAEASGVAVQSGSRAIYEVVLGRDRVLRLPAEFDEARVAALVRVVASC